jgi:hypothetical protein
LRFQEGDYLILDDPCEVRCLARFACDFDYSGKHEATPFGWDLAS